MKIEKPNNENGDWWLETVKSRCNRNYGNVKVIELQLKTPKKRKMGLEFNGIFTGSRTHFFLLLFVKPARIWSSWTCSWYVLVAFRVRNKTWLQQKLWKCVVLQISASKCRVEWFEKSGENRENYGKWRKIMVKHNNYCTAPLYW